MELGLGAEIEFNFSSIPQRRGPDRHRAVNVTVIKAPPRPYRKSLGSAVIYECLQDGDVWVGRREGQRTPARMRLDEVVPLQPWPVHEGQSIEGFELEETFELGAIVVPSALPRYRGRVEEVGQRCTVTWPEAPRGSSRSLNFAAEAVHSEAPLQLVLGAEVEFSFSYFIPARSGPNRRQAVNVTVIGPPQPRSLGAMVILEVQADGRYRIGNLNAGPGQLVSELARLEPWQPHKGQQVESFGLEGVSTITRADVVASSAPRRRGWITQLGAYAEIKAPQGDESRFSFSPEAVHAPPPLQRVLGAEVEFDVSRLRQARRQASIGIAINVTVISRPSRCTATLKRGTWEGSGDFVVGFIPTDDGRVIRFHPSSLTPTFPPGGPQRGAVLSFIHISLPNPISPSQTANSTRPSTSVSFVTGAPAQADVQDLGEAGATPAPSGVALVHLPGVGGRQADGDLNDGS